MDPVRALEQAVYYLDRELAPTAKVRAFLRAIEIVSTIRPAELRRLVDQDDLGDLPGIGPSTGAVIADAVLDRPSAYLTELDERSRVPINEGADLRAALRGDCHAHSTWSDGGASIAAMAEAAAAIGHDYLVITDHSVRLKVARGLDERRLSEQLVEVAEINEVVAPFRVLTGIEVDILPDGSLDLGDEVLAELDLVVASVHSKFRLPREEMTRRMVTAIASPHVDVLGHMTNRKITGRGRAPCDFDAEIVFAACARFDTAIEVNCRPERLDPPDDLLALAAEWECPFTIDTDAHAPGQLEWQAYGCDMAARAGVGVDSVVNSWPVDDLLAWAHDHGVG